MKKKILGLILIFVMIVGALPVTAFAVDSSEVTFPVTVTLQDSSTGSKITRTFNSADELLKYGVPQSGVRSNWYFKTYKRVFLGWSTNPRYADPAAVNTMDPKERIYRDNEPFSEVIKDLEKVDEDTVLYAVSMSITDLMAMGTILNDGGGTFHTSVFQSAEDIFKEKDLIKENLGQDDMTATSRKVVAYYDGSVEKYDVRGISEFVYNDPRVPILVVENPFGIIRSARNITDFSGLNPTGYSYEDLHVVINENATCRKEQKNWEFSSSTFMVAAVLDKNGNLLPMTELKQPDPNSLISKFSFENTNGENEFIIRTIPRNDNSDGTYENNTYPSNNIGTVNGADILKPMTLATGDWGNVTIDKSQAKAVALGDEEKIVKVNGDISGKVSTDKKEFTGKWAFIGFLIPSTINISKIEASNDLVYDFVPGIVKFNKNTEALNDTSEQTIGYSIFALNAAMDSDDFNTDTPPGKADAMGDTFDKEYVADQRYEINGKTYVFKGWNTKEDGTGAFVDKDTVLTREMFSENEIEDINLYGIWKSTHKVTYKFVSNTNDKTLPEEVEKLLPEEQINVENGKLITPATPAKTEITVEDGTWKFDGYTPETATVNGADVTFEGGWSFTENAKYSVKHTFKSSTEDQALPDEIAALLPEDQTGVEDNTEVTPKMPAKTEVEVDGGVWKFDGYTPEKATVNGADVTFEGSWTFIENGTAINEYSVKYIFVSNTKNKSLPKEVLNLVPEVQNGIEDGTQLSPVYPAKEKVKVDGGKWTFDGYKPDSAVVDGADVLFKGGWTFTKNEIPVVIEKYDVKYAFFSNTEGMKLPKEVMALLPKGKTGIKDGTTVTALAPAETEVAVSDGKWKFDGYTYKTATINGKDITFKGGWTFLKDTKSPRKDKPKVLTTGGTGTYKTGDTSNTSPWVIVFVLSMIGILSALVLPKKGKAK